MRNIFHSNIFIKSLIGKEKFTLEFTSAPPSFSKLPEICWCLNLPSGCSTTWDPFQSCSKIGFTQELFEVWCSIISSLVCPPPSVRGYNSASTSSSSEKSQKDSNDGVFSESKFFYFLRPLIPAVWFVPLFLPLLPHTWFTLPWSIHLHALFYIYMPWIQWHGNYAGSYLSFYYPLQPYTKETK